MIAASSKVTNHERANNAVQLPLGNARQIGKSGVRYLV
jgi:hypothetical protein